ncbi:MAG: hypothetical protein PWP23_63 [Candidatus Sumerlaeota bacterium]|nr:hypothetical protein [Candidatus Sumerlaeota bacterium]
MSALSRHDEALRRVLETLYAEFHRPGFLDSDPLAFVHRFDDPADREVVALIAASFAFGNVVTIRRAVEAVLRPLLPHPAQCLRETEPRELARLYRGFVYRWVRAQDVRLYLAWIGSALRAHGSLHAAWQQVDRGEETILPALGRWVGVMTAMPSSPLRERRRTVIRKSGTESNLPSGARLLLTSPEGRSGCKRMNMFLRWVCRPDDGIDLGLWNVSPARLVMPVDTHVLKAARTLGLTRRRTADLRTALEITEALRRVCPDDPTRYDFALVRPGILRLRQMLTADALTCD